MASAERFRPSVTVAAVIEQAGRCLLVEEHTPEGLRLNNPAGHLEPGETLVQAVVREVLEETARPFVPEALVGVYLARLQGAADEAGARSDLTYLRFAFAGRAGDVLPGRALDDGIERTLWLTLAEVRASASRHRSPLVLRCIEDHAAGRRYPLQTLVTHPGLGLA